MQNYPKHIKKQLRQLIGEAYENELAIHLTALESKFAAWRAGEIYAGDLSILIHEYDHGPSRKMFSYYNSNLGDDILVAGAVAKGFLKQEDISPEVWALIEDKVEFFRG